MSTTPITTQQERVAELQTQLQRGVESLTNATNWKSYLKLMQTAYRYSPRNSCLIWLQRPNATLVHGYKDWQKLGRQVERGSKAIHLLAPVTYKLNDEDRRPDEPERRALRCFRVVSVFDISQTTGPELPDMAPGIVEGNAPKVMWDALARRVAERGYTLIEKEILAYGVEGWTRPGTREMCIGTGYPPAHRLAVLAHEVGHVEMGHTTEGFDYIAHRSLAEVEAESIAYLLSAMAGIDSGPSSFKYLASWAGPKPELLLQVAANVQRVTHSLLESLPEFSRGLAVVDPVGRSAASMADQDQGLAFA